MRAVLLSPGRRGWPVALAAAVLLVVASCGGASNSGSNKSNNSGAQLHGTLTVLAAASLNDAFDEIGQQFHKMHPGVEVKFSYAGSSSLVTQIKQGITADIFASADATNMSAVTSAGLASGQPRTLAHNLLEIMTERGNPKNIRTIQNLANPGLKVVLCAPAVPCGRYAAEMFQKAGVTVHPVSEETSVSGVVTKITLGEADAGVVYKTDVKAAGETVSGVAIPAKQNVQATLSIVKLKDAPNSQAAEAFINYVLSSAGRNTLEGFGFTAPTS